MLKPTDDFGFAGYGALLARVSAAGYEFRRLDARDSSGSRRTFFMRHDVDISPRAALRLGQIANTHGAAASFFFQLNAETYNVFARETLDIIGRLRSLGHCVGLHIDEHLIGDTEQRIAQTLEWFDACCCAIDRVVSFHRPSAHVLSRSYQSFVNAYQDDCWGPERYLSDSRRRLDFVPTLDSWLSGGRTPIQLLLHPEWWYPEPDIAKFWADLRRRRAQELETYMLLNFRRVFETVIAPTEGDIGL